MSVTEGLRSPKWTIGNRRVAQGAVWSALTATRIALCLPGIWKRVSRRLWSAAVDACSGTPARSSNGRLRVTSTPS